MTRYLYSCFIKHDQNAPFATIRLMKVIIKTVNVVQKFWWYIAVECSQSIDHWPGARRKWGRNVDKNVLSFTSVARWEPPVLGRINILFSVLLFCFICIYVIFVRLYYASEVLQLFSSSLYRKNLKV